MLNEGKFVIGCYLYEKAYPLDACQTISEKLGKLYPGAELVIERLEHRPNGQSFYPFVTVLGAKKTAMNPNGRDTEKEGKVYGVLTKICRDAAKKEG